MYDVVHIRQRLRDDHLISYRPWGDLNLTTSNFLPMGTKRDWEGQPLELHPKDTIMAEAESAPSILSIFENFRDELDEHHDRRERIIKKSRDITALSKKMYASTSSQRRASLTRIPLASSPFNESAQRTNPSHLKSPKKTKPASTKSRHCSKLSSPNN